jgi:leucyl-tRNA synthetase
MSKSKGNVVDPEELIDRFGADTVRLFCLFAAPPERDLEWTSEGVEGSYRFIGRIWNLVAQVKNYSVPRKAVDETDRSRQIRRLTHKTIKKVTDDIQNRFHFNTAVAAVMEMANEIGRVMQEESQPAPAVALALHEAVRSMVILLSPFIPHVCEELWEALGEKPGMVRTPWPNYDPALLEQDQVVLVVQVNGKKRGEIVVSVDASEEEIRTTALEQENVGKFLEGKSVRKTVLVPGRILNLVVG